jgi:methionine synthase I (cobalamin-dependent)
VIFNSAAAYNSQVPELFQSILRLGSRMSLEVIMQNWKKAFVFGSIGAGAVLIFTGRRPVGMACAAAGLAVLASEYPEKFEAVWESAPDYLQRECKYLPRCKKWAKALPRKPSAAV